MEGSIELAWGLTIAASLSTVLGAAIVLCVPGGKAVPKPLVSCSLGCASGVMLYVGCAELFQKSQEEFLAAGEKERQAKLLSTFCFFGGATFVWLMNLIVHRIAPSQMHNFELSNHHAALEDKLEKHDHGISVAAGGHDHGDGEGWHAHSKKNETPVTVHVDDTSAYPNPNLNPPTAPCCGTRKVNCGTPSATQMGHSTGQQLRDFEEPAVAPVPLELQIDSNMADEGNDEGHGGINTLHTIEEEKKDAALYRLGLSTVLAIALHNYPEGLASFLAARTEGRTGVAIAFGVILHNIPEGLCVAAPIFAATKSPYKAIGWAIVAGLAELAGGITGQILVSATGEDLGSSMYGVLYGVVNGIVVMISALEFLPTAIAFDETPNKVHASGSFLLGMAIIATTLVAEVY